MRRRPGMAPDVPQGTKETVWVSSAPPRLCGGCFARIGEGGRRDAAPADGPAPAGNQTPPLFVAQTRSTTASTSATT